MATLLWQKAEQLLVCSSRQHILNLSTDLACDVAFAEYLVLKYGNGRFQATEAGYLDNLYCKRITSSPFPRRITFFELCLPDSHYAEGSLMPLLVQKIIFDIIPRQSPFVIRPLVSMVFAQLQTHLVQPEIRKHINLVNRPPSRINGSAIN